MAGTRRGRRALAAGAVAAVGIGGARLMTAAVRRWEATHDPTGGDPLGLPELDDEWVVETPDGARLAVGVAGSANDGATFVLAHCWTGDRRVWAPVVRHLMKEHRVVVYDHRGHGASSIGASGLTIEALADDLRAVLDHLDATDVVVAGHSLGGMAAQAFAIAHPDVARRRVRHLVLVATAAELSGSRSLVVPAPSVLGSRLLDRVLARASLGPVLVRGTVGREVCLPHLQAVIETLVATSPDTRAELLRSMAAMDLRAGLPSVDLPVVVVVGTRDRLTPPARSRSITALVPDGRLEVIDGAGHMLPWEPPDQVAEILQAIA